MATQAFDDEGLISNFNSTSSFFLDSRDVPTLFGRKKKINTAQISIFRQKKKLKKTKLIRSFFTANRSD
jgi:hypothetical protein